MDNQQNVSSQAGRSTTGSLKCLSKGCRAKYATVDNWFVGTLTQDGSSSANQDCHGSPEKPVINTAHAVLRYKPYFPAAHICTKCVSL